MIIGFLWSDKESLCICSQVARHWLPSSQSLLFHKTSVSLSDYKPGRLADFIDLLHSSKQIGRYIRCLILHGPNDPVFSDPCTLEIEVVEVISPKLPNLSRLVLGGVGLIIPNASRAKGSFLPSLKCLSLRYMEIFGELSSVLRYFARVDNLELINIFTERPQRVSPKVNGIAISPEYPGIRSLKLQVDRDARSRSIHEGIQLESLLELDFSFSEPAHLRIISPIIRNVPRLRHLKLCLDAFQHGPFGLSITFTNFFTLKFDHYLFVDPPERWTELNLTSLTSLETLSIVFRLQLRLTPRDHAIWSSVTSLLSSAPSTLSNVTFSDMTLNFFRYEEKYLELHDWKSLEQSLSRFSQLQAVRIIIGFGADEDELTAMGGSREIFEKSRAIIQQQLRDLHVKGKLEVGLKGDEYGP